MLHKLSVMKQPSTFTTLQMNLQFPLSALDDKSNKIMHIWAHLTSLTNRLTVVFVIFFPGNLMIALNVSQYLWETSSSTLTQLHKSVTVEERNVGSSSKTRKVQK